MKRRWNQRSLHNAAHAIADFNEDWQDLETFFATGRDDVNKVLDLAKWSAEQTEQWQLLEIGCGQGRMTRHLAQRFRHVTALDVSGEMIRRARQLHPDSPNITFIEGSGVDLANLPDAQFDAVLSYIVFQHLPSRQIVYAYIEESLRVLKPSGTMFFQARNDFVHGRTGTYAGDSIEIQTVQSLAQKHQRTAEVVEGQGTQYCYIRILPQQSAARSNADGP